MSDLTFNKIAGGVLLTGLVIFGLREASTVMFQKHDLEKAGYEIAVEESTGGGGAAAVEVAPDWGTALLLPANIAAGQAVAAKCSACHKLDSGGANGIGPGLWGILGHQPGSHAGYAYSGAMKEFGAKNPVWDYDHMYEFLKAPGKYVSGTNMSFVGLKKPEDRVAIIAYLHSLGSTLPVPAPKPAEAAAPAAPAEGAPATAPEAGAAAAGAPAAPAAAPAAP
ncbi:c-type cytochrome [Caulobacter sp. ErkDOM-E]|uniref:c-type cytochrome n=1 Tax=Caulobacter sp. ErkDOM-E TaxID=3402778 RepID=UPI003AF8A889